jgi:Tfp pilus assembly protein PilV
VQQHPILQQALQHPLLARQVMQQHPLLHQVLQQRLMQQMQQQTQQQPQQQPQAQQGWQGNQGIGGGFGADPYGAYGQQAQNPYAYGQGAGQFQGGPQAMPGYTVH